MAAIGNCINNECYSLVGRGEEGEAAHGELYEDEGGSWPVMSGAYYHWERYHFEVGFHGQLWYRMNSNTSNSANAY